MSKRSPELLIDDIRESGRKILEYTSGFTLDQFKSDPQKKYVIHGIASCQ